MRTSRSPTSSSTAGVLLVGDTRQTYAAAATPAPGGCVSWCLQALRASDPVLPVRRMLRPPSRRVLPVFLSAVRREVEDVVDEEQPVHAPLRGRVRPVDIVAVAEEQAQQEAATGTGVRREARATGRVEGDRPAVPLDVRRELVERHVGHGGPGDAVREQTVEVRDIVREVRAAG